jgi:hypothetical protein
MAIGRYHFEQQATSNKQQATSLHKYWKKEKNYFSPGKCTVKGGVW